jgi:hypothetical protein
VNPKFVVTVIPDRNVQKQPAIITEAEGNILKTVNNMPLIPYLQTLGLTKEAGIGAIGFLPLIVNYRDGTKSVARSIYGLTPEGWAVCGDDMPVGGTLSIGSLDYHGVMETAEVTLKQILDAKNITSILLYPCMSRMLMLGPNSNDEMERLMNIIGNKHPYQICYAGGELCPLPDTSGKLINYFHNYTFVACAFQE